MGIKDQNGQMTVEFMAVLPALLIVAIIAVNTLLFFSECAAFDRIGRDAIRTYACSPAYGQSAEQSCSLISQTLSGHFEKDYLTSSVSVSGNSWGHTTYTLTLTFFPTLFGMGFRSSVLGVTLPQFDHSISLTVDSYKPGVLL